MSDDTHPALPDTPPPATPALFYGQDAATVKRTASQARADLTRATAALRRQSEEAKADMARRREAMEAELRRAQAELQAQMAPLLAQIEQMKEISWTVDLYLGRDETLRLIRDGVPAPVDTPITIRQRVLVMAEESLLMMGTKSTGMTAEDLPEFIDWLCSDDANLNRVLPEPRGVVVMVPTRVESRTGNPWEDAAKDAANEASYWLLRNGERLYLLTVDPELRVRNRVLPLRDEFIQVFDQRLFGFGSDRSRPVEPGSEEWLDMQKRADARRRHYMRIMLVLQGIADRTPAWHPLPGGHVNLLSVAAQDSGQVVLFTDADPTNQLTDGREDFRTWQRRLNALLRPGLRVIVATSSEGFSAERETDYDGRVIYGRHSRLYPRNASYPPSDTPLLAEERRDGGLVLRYDRTDHVYRSNVPVPDRPGYVYSGQMATAPTRRASCLVRADDTWVLPFDLAAVEDLEYYLNSGENRSKHFLTMVPAVQTALAAKRAEAEAEAPFRRLLADVLTAEGAEDPTGEVDRLVHWWKIAKTWSKPLNGDPTHEGKAAREIVAEFVSRQRSKTDHDQMVTRARQEVPGAIAVARNRQGEWYAYTPSIPAHDDGVFLDVSRLYRDGRTVTVPWQTLTQRTASTLDLAWSDGTWQNWKFAANPHHYLTGPQRDVLLAAARERAAGRPVAVTEYFDPADPTCRILAVYCWTVDDDPEAVPPRPTPNPFEWRERSRSQIRLTAWTVRKDRSGNVRLGKPYEGSRVPADFGHFTAADRTSISLPWWPDDRPGYGDVRPRLSWSDPDLLASVQDYAARCRQAADEARTARYDREATVDRYVRPIQSLIAARREAAIRARFVEDFGDNADDLFAAHLKTLNLTTDPVHPRTLWGLVTIALDHDHPVAGQTLASLNEFALAHGNNAHGEWHPDRGLQDLAGYGDVIVPDPTPDQTQEQP